MYETYIKKAEDTKINGRPNYVVAKCVEAEAQASNKVLQTTCMIDGVRCFTITTEKKFSRGQFINIKKELGMLKAPFPKKA